MSYLKNIFAALKNLFSKKIKKRIDVVECSRSEFRAFLDGVYIDKYYDFEAYCDDLQLKIGSTGGVEYEISYFHKDSPICFQCNLKEIEWVGSADEFENGEYPTFLWVE